MIATDTQDVFTIFHDGWISNFSGDRARLELTIECEYLAHMIDPEYELFSVELTNVDYLSLVTWPRNQKESNGVIYDVPKIFQAELEISSAELNRDGVTKVYCLQYDQAFDYTGVTLSIKCEAIQVFDHVGRPITLDEMKKIADEYW